MDRSIPSCLSIVEQFWTDAEYHLWADEWRGYYPLWQNLNVFEDLQFESGGIFMVTLAGKSAFSAEGMAEESIVAQVMGVLRKMFKNATEPTDVHVTRW